MMITCPNCGEMISLDRDSAYGVLQQIRDSEFRKEVDNRVAEATEKLERIQKLEARDRVSFQITHERNKYDKQIAELTKQHDEAMKVLQNKCDKLQDENKQLSLDAEAARNNGKIQVLEAVESVKEEKSKLENELITVKAQSKVELEAQKNEYAVLLKQKDEQIDFYKDLKTKMSTKMVGETLEQHCETEFNRIRMTAFPNAYFEKDNDARSGSKGDYIYREYDENDVEILSIMFEMKNENDTTATKHKNEHFFKELDKDRNEKKCEYAVLVSLLESDSELYNGGIVDVSYKYPKMYVVRPQCFLTIISILRNASLGALEYKRELALVRNQNIDISHFEENLLKFKDAFSRNYELAHKHFNTAVDEIDKTIDHLQKVKDFLLRSDNQYRIANDKADNITVKRLTKDNPTMRAIFDAAAAENEH